MLRAQLTAMSTEPASLRERIGRTRAISLNHPPAMVLFFSRRSSAKAVVSSGVVSQAIPEMGLSCCRSSGWMRLWSTTPMPAIAAAPCCGVRIQSRCGTR